MGRCKALHLLYSSWEGHISLTFSLLQGPVRTQLSPAVKELEQIIFQEFDSVLRQAILKLSPFLQLRFGLFEVGGVKPLGKPRIDRG